MVELKLILLIFCSLFSIFRLSNSRAILSLSCSCVSYFLLKSDSADTKIKIKTINAQLLLLLVKVG